MNHFVEKVLGKLTALEADLEEMKVSKQMMLDSIESDEEYVRLKAIAKDASKTANLHKAALLNEPENVKVNQNLRELVSEIKETRAIISDNLIGYFTEEQRLEFEDGSGQLFRFKMNAKLEKTNQPSLL